MDEKNMIHLGLWGYTDLSGSTLNVYGEKIQSNVSHEGI